MTDKKEKILQAALQLFAKEGFYATSTSKIAKVAEVSEGLIFRHFGNKEGLLQTILEEGEIKMKTLMVDIVMETEPKKVIRKAIEMTRKVDKADYDFWKLQYKLKWELEINSDKKMEPLHMALTNAFQKLNYESPQLESQLIILFIDSLGSSVLKGSNVNATDIINLLLKKYEL
ncbi:MAG TPA: helix-turn-helix domain-containing protein [Draconibacterium sp.]|nr:helix-turn-helix domain-containing protein [Draconibacterium sp.]